MKKLIEKIEEIGHGKNGNHTLNFEFEGWNIEANVHCVHNFEPSSMDNPGVNETEVIINSIIIT